MIYDDFAIYVLGILEISYDLLCLLRIACDFLFLQTVLALGVLTCFVRKLNVMSLLPVPASSLA